MARFRTDRHNNPTAFITLIAKQAGLIPGDEYEAGDAFPSGSYRTARLFADPIGLTIKVIDRIGFWNRRGAPRWVYIGSIIGSLIATLTKKQLREVAAFAWSLLSKKQKTVVIGKMYQHEGGKEMKNLFKEHKT